MYVGIKTFDWQMTGQALLDTKFITPSTLICQVGVVVEYWPHMLDVHIHWK